jgi:UDP-3-O-[3-hydroxymyristoyl] glucosamine N-acyltransferase
MSSLAGRAWSLADLARRFELELSPAEAGAVSVHGLASVAQATPGTLAPLLSSSPRRRAEALASAASAFLVDRPFDQLARPQLVAAEPRRALAALLELFAPVVSRRAGVHRSAVVEAGARISTDAWVGPFCYVAAGARVGAGCQLESHVHLGAGAQLGEGCQLGPHSAVLAGCVLGRDVEVGAGAIIGSAGFGFALGPDGPERLRSLSTVELGDEVAVGANSCVDRGTLAPTRVEAKAKIDNLVQLGHNVEVGSASLICAQAGLAGSVVVGQGALLGGQAGVADHLTIGERARVAAKAGVIGDVAADQSVAGYPARPRARWAREAALLAQLDQLRARVATLETARGAGDDG